MERPEPRLLIFARAPEPGRVKTRLIPALGAGPVARLYEAMARRCIAQASRAALGPVELWCDPDQDHPFFQAMAREHSLPLFRQEGPDLGGRMVNAFESARRRGTPVVIIGTDCPSVTMEDVREAFSLLVQGTDVVLGPAEDGGYYLIGLRERPAGLFSGIPWGSPAVLDVTRERVRQAGLVARELPVRWDVDRPEDVRRLEASGLLG